ncbi:ATP-binding protein [Microbacterium sp. NPDC078814]|uniref:AlbA family DNA-binding domain-containing protein n=1 Tax=Microbacterium sp. NPDC078814 TaxID=3154767 RepID=UPI00344C9983
MLDDEQLAAIIEVGYEQRGVEFKAAGDRTDRAFLATVARAVLALSNQRDGGHVIIGLSEDGVDADGTGLSDEQLGQWLSFDDVTDQINAYADPPVRIQLGRGRLPNDRAVAIIEVAEFSEIPTLSKKDYPQRIVAKQLYTRSLAKPESSISMTQNELREVIALATEKQLARFLETAQRAGVRLGQAEATGARDEFEAQAQRALSSGFHLDATLPQLVTTIRPESFDARRIPFPDLLSAVQTATVRRRGWPFPWVQYPTSGRDWAGEHNSSMHPETWQFFESGQFLDSRAIEDYGPDADGFLDDRQPINGYLPIWLPLLHFTEVIEFAGRLQRAQFSSEPMSVKLALRNIRGFVLVTAHRNRSGLHSTYMYNDDTWDYEILLSPEEGLTSPRELAVDAALDLLQRFNWRGVTRELLQGIQVEVFGPEQP